MEIIKLGETLEIGREIELKIKTNNGEIILPCSPENLEELIIGFAISEGLSRNPKVILDKDTAILEVDGEFPIEKINPKVKFKIDHVKRFISLLDTDYYKRTRAYHTAIIVSGDKYLRAYDVGRHNSIDKAIGLAYRNGFDFSKSFMVITGRITGSVAKKCVRAGIPLIASKAAIIDSAIEVCRRTGLSAISFATNIVVNNGAIEV